MKNSCKKLELVINDNGQTFVIKQWNVALTCYVMRLLVDSLIQPVTKSLLGVAVITALITLVLKDPPQWVQIEHFWREFSSVDHYSGGKSFYLDEEEN
ncbi:hypothetical protein L3X38_041670 [Prunus dulcis]|uniref:Uncharacterized protein n=1 Tax=Prunus dulcis TaxID=3755 RepID=A0AAD4UVD0_PRUDU|nr:hypothetical protein L3X38_041670 [Prunus dulcis]